MSDFNVHDEDPFLLFVPTVARGIGRKLRRRRERKEVEWTIEQLRKLAPILSAQPSPEADERA
jgi:hypothetical protein